MSVDRNVRVWKSTKTFRSFWHLCADALMIGATAAPDSPKGLLIRRRGTAASVSSRIRATSCAAFLTGSLGERLFAELMQPSSVGCILNPRKGPLARTRLCQYKQSQNTFVSTDSLIKKKRLKTDFTFPTAQRHKGRLGAPVAPFQYCVE